MAICTAHKSYTCQIYFGYTLATLSRHLAVFCFCRVARGIYKCVHYLYKSRHVMFDNHWFSLLLRKWNIREAFECGREGLQGHGKHSSITFH